MRANEFLHSVGARTALTVIVMGFAGTGCAAIRMAFRSAFGSNDVQLSRRAPAQVDLPEIATVAVPAIDGQQEDSQAISGYVAQWVGESGRFQVVERDKFAELARQSGCDGSDPSCVGKALPASAVVVGSVTPSSYHENVSSQRYECQKDGKKATCSTNTRSGSATVSANLRLVAAADGRVLYQGMISKTTKAETSAEDSAPAPIDSPGLVEEARRQVARAFFEAICPHDVDEKVTLAIDGDLPELEQATDLARHGKFDDAAALLERAVKKGDSAHDLDVETRAKAHYSFGVVLAAQKNYDRALGELASAVKSFPNDDWENVEGQVKQWKQDAEAAQKQLAFASTARPAASLATSAGATSTGAQ